MSWLPRIKTWLRSFFISKRWIGLNAEDMPDRPASQTVYLLGDEGALPWAAALECPCGCKEVIQLSLVSRDNPSWRADVGDGGTVSLYPSIWRVRGCRSHFFIREGRIRWVKGGRPSHGRPAPGKAPSRNGQQQ